MSLIKALWLALLLISPAALADGLVLTYHHIGSPGGITLSVTPERLERQLLALREAGYVFVTAEEHLTALRHERRVATVTFDDGFVDVFEQALPVLERLGIPATVFIITSRVGSEGFMTWEQLALLQARGWHVGSHTMTHAALTDLSPTGIAREVQGAAAALTPQLGDMTRCFAYPLGRHDARVRAIIAQAHPCAFSTGRGLNTIRTDPYALHRPLAHPWGPAGLNWQPDVGEDFRIMLLPTVLGYALLPSGAPAVRAPGFHHAARAYLLGDAQLSLRLEDDVLYQDVFLRAHRVSISGVFARLGGAYTEVALAVNLDLLVLALGMADTGLVLGASIPIQGYGELWGQYDPGDDWSVGIELVPLDYTRLKLELHSERGLAIESHLALPLLVEEARPLRMLAGFRVVPYFGSVVRLGSFELDTRLDTRGGFSVSLGAMW